MTAAAATVVTVQCPPRNKVSFGWNKNPSNKVCKRIRPPGSSNNTGTVVADVKKPVNVPSVLKAPVMEPWKETVLSVLSENRQNIPPTRPSSSVSLYIYLFREAFLCRNISAKYPEGGARPYNRFGRDFLQSIDLGLIPYDVAGMIPCRFINGQILTEIQDFRQTSVRAPVTTASIPRIWSSINAETSTSTSSNNIKPIVSRVFLRPTQDMMLRTIQLLVHRSNANSPPLSLRQRTEIAEEDDDRVRLSVEESLLRALYSQSSLCLDPSVDVFNVATALYANGPRYQSLRGNIKLHSYRTFEKPIVKPSLSLLNNGNSSSSSSLFQRSNSVSSSSNKTNSRKRGLSSDSIKVENAPAEKKKPRKRVRKKPPPKTNTTSAEKEEEGLEFLTSLLDDAPEGSLSLTTDVSPVRLDRMLAMNQQTAFKRKAKGGDALVAPHSYQSLLDLSPSDPLPKVFTPLPVSNPAWLKAAEVLRRKSEISARANIEHFLTNLSKSSSTTTNNSSALSSSSYSTVAGRGSVRQQACQLGTKTIWPTECIANSRMVTSASPRTLSSATEALMKAALRDSVARVGNSVYIAHEKESWEVEDLRRFRVTTNATAPRNSGGRASHRRVV